MSQGFGTKETGGSTHRPPNDMSVTPPGAALRQGYLPEGDFADRAFELFTEYDQSTGEAIPAPAGAINPDTGKIEASGVIGMVDLTTEPHEILKRVGEVTVQSDGHVNFVSETGF